jgi:hypothetical protein
MKTKFLMIMGSLLALTSASADIFQNDINDCLRLESDSRLCFQMKHLRGELRIIESQRELMRTDYDLLAELGFEMTALIDLSLGSSSVAEHVDLLVDLKDSATEMVEFAVGRDSRALVKANALQGSCLGCHAPQSPPSGYSWAQINGLTWDEINKSCQELGRNPYVCKSMYSMVTGVSYFQTYAQSGLTKTSGIGMVAKEMARISTDLRRLGVEHANASVFTRVEEGAREVIDLAQEGSPLALEKAQELVQSCQSCHGQ